MQWFICTMNRLLDIDGHTWFSNDELFTSFGGPVMECYNCGVIIYIHYDHIEQVRGPKFE